MSGAPLPYDSAREPVSPRVDSPRTASIPSSPPSGVNALRGGQPYDLSGVGLMGGSIPAARPALQALALTIFGEDRAWQPASDRIYFDLGRVPGAGGMNGTDPWCFLCVRMLVQNGGTGEYRAVVTHAFVDRVLATTIGREVFGFPAIPALFALLAPGAEAEAEGAALPADLAEALRAGGAISVRTDVLTADTRMPKAREIVRLEFERSDAGSERARTERTEGFVWEELRASVARTQGTSGIPFLQLKQMRDAIEPVHACYQDLVEGSVTAGMTGPVEEAAPRITVHDYRSFPLARCLGLGNGPSSADARFTFVPEAGYFAREVALSFAIDFDRRMEPVRSGRAGVPFRFRAGDPQFAPAYEFRNVALTGFKLPVARDAVRRIVDEALNGPSFAERGYRYEPASTDVIVECLDYDSMAAANPPPGLREGDSTGQRELVFRILVGRVDRGSSFARGPAVFCPFLFVDSSWSLISGREIIGYPKEFASFERLEHEGELVGCRVRRPGASGVAAELLTIDCREDKSFETLEEALERRLSPSPRRGGARTRPARQGGSHAWWGLADLQGTADLDWLVGPWLQGSTHGYGAVQVKRFADARRPEQADYVEILEGDYTVRNMDVSLPVHRAVLRFASEEPFGPRAQFGFKEHTIIPAGSWYRARCDFRVRILDPLA